MIEARNIIKSFRNGTVEQTVLKGVSLRINQGEFVAIIGRSGAGKSTLMYQLSLLDTPTSGSVVLDNTDTSEFSEPERSNFRLSHLGYVFQDYALLPELTAEENVIVPLLMRGETVQTARKRSEAALARIGLAQKFNNLPSQLSGGEQQRVSIARAIAHQPKIIFADEPTANLDTETSKVVMQAFLDLHAEGETIVMVTHEPEYAAMTDRIITLRDGAIISDERTKKASK